MVQTGHTVSMVSEGEVLAPGDVLRQKTAPAGLDVLTTYTITLQNEVRNPYVLGQPGGLASAEGFHWVTPTEQLSSETSANRHRVQSKYRHRSQRPHCDSSNPSPRSSNHPNATSRGATSTQNGHGGPIWLHLGQRRLRRIFLKPFHGYQWVRGHPRRRLGERHLRALRREGGWSSNAVYDHSENGEVWSSATVAPGGWAFDCDYGLERFVCARDYGDT